MKPAAAKAKGRRLQQHVRDSILSIFNKELTPDDVRSTSMGNQGEDVQLSAKARAILQCAIECKSRARVAIYRDYEQAEEHAAKAGEAQALVVIKENKSKPLAIVDLDWYLKLCYDAWQYRNLYLEQHREESKTAALLKRTK